MRRRTVANCNITRYRRVTNYPLALPYCWYEINFLISFLFTNFTFLHFFLLLLFQLSNLESWPLITRALRNVWLLFNVCFAFRCVCPIAVVHVPSVCSPILSLKRLFSQQEVGGHERNRGIRFFFFSLSRMKIHHRSQHHTNAHSDTPDDSANALNRRHSHTQTQWRTKLTTQLCVFMFFLYACVLFFCVSRKWCVLVFQSYLLFR